MRTAIGGGEPAHSALRKGRGIAIAGHPDDLTPRAIALRRARITGFLGTAIPKRTRTGPANWLELGTLLVALPVVSLATLLRWKPNHPRDGARVRFANGKERTFPLHNIKKAKEDTKVDDDVLIVRPIRTTG